MWIEENNTLQRTFKFKNFTEAFAFMTEVALHAEKINHHPHWTNDWNIVFIKLNTKDAGNVITEKDWELVEDIDRVFQKYKDK